MDYWKNNTIWFDEIPINDYMNIDFKTENIPKNNIQSIKYLALLHYKNRARDLSQMPIFNELLYLNLICSNIKTFNGIKSQVKLKRLELHYCTKLENDYGLSGVADTLEHLHINQSKKFVPRGELLTLKNIRVLRLNSCGDLNDLSFLTYFPKLIDFRFVNTNVLDGNLNPIVDHPTIRSVGFVNKRHYNISPRKMDILLNEKCKDQYKVFIHKGESRTFRYID